MTPKPFCGRFDGREVDRVRGAQQAEPQPVGVVGAVAAHGGEETLGGGVRAYDQALTEVAG